MKAKHRKQKFISENPYCYMCGNKNSSQIDHVPSRQCFISRSWPEGFEFPACSNCNNKSGQLEQIAAFYLQWSRIGFSDELPKELAQAAKGIFNNNPKAFPTEVPLSFIEKRKHLKRAGVLIPDGRTYGEMIVLEMPPVAKIAMDTFAIKLAFAFFWHQFKMPIPRDHLVHLNWKINEQSFEKLHEETVRLIGPIQSGVRNKQLLAEQFCFWIGTNDSPARIGFRALFHGQVLFSGMIYEHNKSLPYTKTAEEYFREFEENIA